MGEIVIVIFQKRKNGRKKNMSNVATKIFLKQKKNKKECIRAYYKKLKQNKFHILIRLRDQKMLQKEMLKIGKVKLKT